MDEILVHAAEQVYKVRANRRWESRETKVYARGAKSAQTMEGKPVHDIGL